MEDEFEAFKPTYAPKSFYNWNVEDLKDYQEQLKAEIFRIDEIYCHRCSESSIYK